MRSAWKHKNVSDLGMIQDKRENDRNRYIGGNGIENDGRGSSNRRKEEEKLTSGHPLKLRVKREKEESRIRRRRNEMESNEVSCFVLIAKDACEHEVQVQHHS